MARRRGVRRPASSEASSDSPRRKRLRTASHRSGSGSHFGTGGRTRGSRTRSLSWPKISSASVPPGEVRGGHALADVAAGPGEARLAVDADGGPPVARHTQRSAPAMRDCDIAQDGALEPRARSLSTGWGRARIIPGNGRS
jgi:hypothetical protein